MEQEDEFIQTKKAPGQAVAEKQPEPVEQKKEESPPVMKVTFEASEVMLVLKSIEEADGFKLARTLGIQTPLTEIYQAMYNWFVTVNQQK